MGHPVVCALTSSRLDSFSVFVTHILAVMITKFFFWVGGSFHPSNTLNRTLIPKAVSREQTKLTTIPVISCPNTSWKHNINLVVHNWHFLLPFPYLNAGFTRLLGHKYLPNQHWKEMKGKLASVSTIMTRIVGQTFGPRWLQRLDEIHADLLFSFTMKKKTNGGSTGRMKNKLKLPRKELTKLLQCPKSTKSHWTTYDKHKFKLLNWYTL